MNPLTRVLIEDVVDSQKIVAIYGGGFKPPTKGHFSVAKEALKQYPEIDDLKIFVGGKSRDGITQEQSINIWNIYKNYLSGQVDIEPSVAPVKSVLGYAKEHPEEKVYWILGTREGDEDDVKDVINRTKSVSKYPNLEVKIITTSGGVSGTKTRKTITDNDKETFFSLIPDIQEKEQIWNMVKDLKEAVTPDELEKADAYADKQLGINVDLTSKHILDRLTGRESDVTFAQLIGFFKRLGKRKKEFLDFFKNFKEIVATDKITNLNIPFLNTVNKAIAKTIMRKDNFMTSSPKLVFEGRYDTITRTVVRDIIDEWKSQYDGGTGKFELEEDYNTVNSKGQPLKFELYAVLTVRKTKYGIYRVDGGADPTRKLPYLEVKFQVDPRDLPQKWEEIYMDLIDVVRHEIEHMTQQGPNVVASTTTYKNKKGEEVTRFDSKEMADDEFLRNLIKLKFLPKSDYYKLEQEVDAMLQGMYLKAKKLKTPFKDVIDNYFDKARVAKKDRKDILDLWKKRAKALSLPLNEIGDASAKIYSYKAIDSPEELITKADKFFSTPRSDKYFYEKVTYVFDTDKAKYVVNFHPHLEKQKYLNLNNNPNFKPGPPYKTYASVGFTTVGNPEEKETNLNEQFSVLSTITNIVLDFVERLNKAGGNIVSLQVPPKEDTGKDSKIDSKRGKLYAAYIRKNLSKIPNYSTRERTNNKGQEYIEIYKSNNLNEVGEASTTPYKWKEEYNDDMDVEVSFETESGLEYNVGLQRDVYKGIPILEVEFVAGVIDPDFGGGMSSKITTNRGELFKVMSTIVDIIRYYVKNTEAQGVTYSPSKKGDETISTNQRNTLYKAFLKKQVPGVEFKQDSDYVVALFPGYEELDEAKEPAKGTGKKPKGSSRRLYTDENPKDTVGIKFSTKQDIIDTLNKASFKSKPHARQSQIINVIHQRVRAAYGRAKDPEVKKRLKTALDYAEQRKEASKKKTERLKKQKNENVAPNHDGKAAPYGSGYEVIEEIAINLSNYDGQVLPGDVLRAPKGFPLGGKKLEKSLELKVIKNSREGVNRYKLSLEDPKTGKKYSVRNFQMDGEYKGKKLPQWGLVRKSKENIKERITATEVICDGCGWSWDKKDGGDDLYMCHKCGHDNTPESDPFGLNELAKDFVKEVFEEVWNPKESFISLSQYMKDNGMNITPLPKIKVINDDKENASNLLGKTAYYDPNTKSITLYTLNRHPKDILRSFAHEMVHHEQNLNGVLGNITTTNTNEDGDLPEIEREAYEKGNMMLRNWEDGIKNV